VLALDSRIRYRHSRHLEMKAVQFFQKSVATHRRGRQHHFPRSTSNLAILNICKAAPCGIVRQRSAWKTHRHLSFVSCTKIRQAMCLFICACRTVGTNSAQNLTAEYNVGC